MFVCFAFVAPHKCYIAFRYSDPLTDKALEEITADNVKRVVAFSQYPQYSCSTTGSNLNELYRQVQTYDPEHQIQWSIIDRWGNHPKLITVNNLYILSITIHGKALMRPVVSYIGTSRQYRDNY